MPETKVYISCAAKGTEAATLCVFATQTLEAALTGPNPRIAPLNFNSSRPEILRGNAPMPLVQGVVSIDLKLAQTGLGLAAVMSIATPRAQSLVFEKSLRVMDRKTPVGLGQLEPFLDRFIKRSVVASIEP